MVRIIRLAEDIHVATHAFRGKAKAIELPDRADFVAGIAIDHGMGANQREAILVLIDVVNGDLPAIRVVAEFAFRAVLAAMKIRVTVLTLIRGIAELQVGVAVDAVHFHVAAA